MSTHLTCPQGHRWAPSAADRPTACPVCGAAAESPPASAGGVALTTPALAADPPAEGGGPYPAVPGYEILGELGRGGMGAVYKARQLGLGRLVALKVILHADFAAPEGPVRLRGEAEAAARVRHPNVVQVYEVGEYGGRPFFSMELCPGGSLAARLRAGPVPATEAARLVEALARAVDAAHRQHVVHRDLKPANVLLAEDGTPKVSDFGLAKRLDAAGLTAPGAVMGTPSYMAPEQAAGKPGAVGPACDVYALGAVLYECLTGRPPFKAPTLAETLMQVLSEDPVPPGRLQPGLPRDLETVCLKALRKEPARRYTTAAALADDLARFREGRPVLARPVGPLGRALKWARRRPAAAALLAVTLLGAAALAAVWRVQDRQVSQARAAARAESLVQGLAAADTEHVPAVVAELGAYRRWAEPALRRMLAETPPESRGHLHASLALLPDDPGQVPYLRGRLLECGPGQVAVLREALRGHQAEVAPALWEVLLDGRAGARRLRAAGALAAYAPDDPRWEEVAPAVVAELAAAGPLAAGHWAGALKPARRALLPALGDLARDRAHPEADRLLAAGLVADYAADRPEVLAGLLPDADVRQFHLLFPPLAAHREAAVARLTEALRERPQPRWQDGPVGARPPPPPELRGALEQGGGLLAEHFALCQALPLARFDALAEGLRPGGYRPVRLRPYRRGPDLLVAAVWARDGRAGVWAHGLTADQVRARDEAERRGGRVALDVAGYETDGGDRYAAVWGSLPPGATEHRLLVGLSEPDHAAGWPALREQGLQPLTYQRFVGSGRVVRNCQVWQKRDGPGTWEFRHGPEAVYAEQVANALTLVQTDVGLSRNVWHEDAALRELGAWLGRGREGGPGAAPWPALGLRKQAPGWGHPGRWYSAAWQARPGVEAAEVHGLEPAQHLARCRELAADGYRPAALAVAAVGDEPGAPPVTASLWRRPVVSEAEREAVASRRANAAAALLRLGEHGPVWPLLRHAPDPTLRSFLVQRLARLGVGPEALARRLGEEKDVSARRALVLALGELSPEEAAVRESLAPRLLADYRGDPDPGVHSALDWLLRQRWGLGEALREADRALAGQPRGGRDWFVNRQGDTLAVVRGPVEYTRGSWPADPEGYPRRRLEVPHRCRIGRTFALATREVTRGQFDRFLRDHPGVGYSLIGGEKEAGPDGPVLAVSWYQAAAYCRWLSEQEHVPEGQMCYPPVEQIKPGVELPGDYLSRTGYRLPTEAEWEYACRAGAATSRFYGCGEELLGQYGWFLLNGRDRARPVGRLRPNDLGLFDVLGNVREWCQSKAGTVSVKPLGPPVEDLPGPLRVEREGAWSLRGGSFADFPVAVRCASRGLREPTDRNTTLGLRVARTLPDAAGAPGAR